MKCCCIKGCPSIIRHPESKHVSYYNFPKVTVHTKWKFNQRMKWINAVKNHIKSTDSNWEPTQNTFICSRHFIGNKKSDHPLHPAYVPSIFSITQDTKKLSQALKRFERQKCRKSNESNVEENISIVAESENNMNDNITAVVTGHIPIAVQPITSTATLKPKETASLLSENKVFSSQDELEYIIPHDNIKEQCDDVPDVMSTYYNNEDTTRVMAEEITGRNRHEGLQCDSCKGVIVGFRYTCVQCSSLDLCVTCESNGAHAQHYMLRVPGPRLYNEIHTVLARIRECLLSELEPISTSNLANEDNISVKTEVKLENEDENDNEVPDFHEVQVIDQTQHVDIVNYDNGQKSEPSSTPSGSAYLDSKYSKELSQNNTSIQQHVKTCNPSGMKLRNKLKFVQLCNLNKQSLHIQQHVMIPNTIESINQSSFIRTSDVSESTTPNLGKRKIVVNCSELVKLKESNRIAKKICVMPSTSKRDINKTTPVLYSERMSQLLT